MADRHVRVTLSANVREYSRSVNAAADDTDNLRNAAERFAGRSYRARVDVDIPTRSLAELAALNGALNRVDGRRANARVSVSGGNGASRQVALIMNSISALGPAAITAAASVTGALLAIGSTVGVLAAGLGVAVMGFQGMGDALKAMGDAEVAAGQDAADAAQKRTTATRSIDDARRAVVRAEQDQAQAARQGERDITAAKTAVTKATEDAARANVQAAEAVEDATDDEAVAHQRVRYALEDLSAARKEAIRDMEDMRERSSDLALDEREANLRLAEARDELAEAEANGATSARDLEKARIDVLRAEDRLSDVQRDRTRQTVDLTAAEAAGLEGLSGVVSARRNVEDAERGVRAAREELIKAQQEQTRTERDGSAKIGEAVQALADTRTDAAQRNADAAVRVEDAERNVAQAMADATVQMGEQSTAAKKLQEELSKLGPAGRDFAAYLHSLKPQMKDLQSLAQAGMFPGMEAGIRDLMVIFPDIAYLVDKTSQALGDMSAAAGDALNDPFWRNYIRFLADQAAPIMEGFGRVLGNLIKGFSGMQMAFNPLAQDVIGGLGDMMERFADWGASLDSNTSFQRFVQYVRETGPLVMSTLGSLVNMLGALAVAAAPIGPVVLAAIEGLANALAFIAGVPGLGTTLLAVATAMGALNLAIRVMQIATLSRLGIFLAGLPAMAATASTAMGLMALNMGAGNRAATGVANAGRGLGTVLGALGKALPIVGLAFVAGSMLIDDYRKKSEEAATAVMNGTESMDAAVEAETDRILSMVSFLPWQDEAIEREKVRSEVIGRTTGEMQKQYAELSTLEKRQRDVAAAQDFYNRKLDEFGAQHPMTQSALSELQNKSREVEIQEIMTAHGVDRHTAALWRLRDAAQEAVNADISYDRSLISLEQAQIRAAEAARLHGTDSLEYRDAALAVREANHRVAGAAGEKAEADGKASEASDIGTLKADAQKAAYLTLAEKAKEPLRSELLELANQTNAMPDGSFTITGEGHAQWAGEGGTKWTIDPTGVVSSRIGGLATGGLVSSVLPGYTPGKDVHTFYSPTAGYLGLSGGEGILRPEATRVLGKGGIDGINHAARAGGVSGVARYLGGQAFADGGVFQTGIKPFPDIAKHLYGAMRQPIADAMGPTIAQQMSGGNALPWAMGEAGKPYTWGGVGPHGYDCSGFMAAIINVMNGAPPHRRLGTTATFPWAGMQPGMGPGLSIGNTSNAGNGIGHMAGTLPGGVNVESRSGDGVVVGPRARGAQDRLFNSVWHMPPSKNFAAGGSGAVEGGGPAVIQVREVANRYGWGSGPEWGALSRIISKESGWNPNAANPRSSARGLFQKMTSIHGPVETTPRGQAEWGLGYIRSRYGKPSSALAFHNLRNYYDDGGVASGKGYMPKNVVAPERVLSPRQTVAFEQLVDVLSRPRPVPLMGGGQTVIKHYNLTVQNAGNTTVDLQAQFQRLELMAGV